MRDSREKNLKALKAIKIADSALDPSIRGVLEEVRAVHSPHGWTIHAKRIGSEKLEFVFTNPLSSLSTGMEFDGNLTPVELRRRLDEHVADEPEFARMRLVPPPRRKRELLGGLRYAAKWYGWSREVFEEVIDTLQGLRVLSTEEAEWLDRVGPFVLPEGVELKLREHQAVHGRSRPRAGRG